jgi:hypothetical protein
MSASKMLRYSHENPLGFVICEIIIKKKAKQSRYTPWRRLGGEEV